MLELSLREAIRLKHNFIAPQHILLGLLREGNGLGGQILAAGFLVGFSRGRSIEESLRMGSIAAAEVISHFGARPESDLRKLVEAA